MQSVSWRAVLTAAVAVCAIAPASARAGTYDVWSCRGPDGAALSTAAWTQDATATDTCAGGGALELDDPEVAALRFTLPPGTRIAGYDLWRSLALTPVYESSASVLESTDADIFIADGCPFVHQCRALGDPSQPLAPANHLSAQSAPLDALTLLVAKASFALYRSRVQVDDPVAPVAGDARADGATLLVSGADQGGGIAAVTMALDGGAPQTAASACEPPYTTASPCPGEVDRAFSLAGVAPGAHSASGTVVDAAGNVTPWGPLTFAVAAAPVVPTVLGAAAPVPAVPRLALAPATLVHAAGATAQLHGTLTTADGAPIAGARVTVSAFDLASDGADTRALAPAVTDAAGVFTIALQRDGAQRVIVGYDGAQASAIVRARLGLSLGTRPNRLVKGRLMTLRGHLRGAGPSSAGAVVVIQSIVNGAWQPVGTARARADGSFAWSYRFVHLQRDTIFSFRAVVERAPGWPWASAHSARLRVRVDVP